MRLLSCSTELDYDDLMTRIGGNLGLCSKLQFLELDLPRLDYIDDEKAIYRPVFNMLSHAPQSIRQIALHFYGYNPMHLWRASCSAPGVDWKGAARNIALLEKLERVVIHFHGSEEEGIKLGTHKDDAQAVLRAFAKKAPALAEMNICEVGLNA